MDLLYRKHYYNYVTACDVASFKNAHQLTELVPCRYENVVGRTQMADTANVATKRLGK